MIRTKLDAYDLYLNGHLGNKPLTWDRSDLLYWDVTAGKYTGKVGIRYKGTEKGKYFAYGVPTDDGLQAVDAVLRNWAGQGLNLNQVTFNETTPDDYLTLNAEVMLGIRGYEIRYNLTPGLSNRAAMLDDRMQNAWGLKARMILDKYLDDASLENLRQLFEQHPSPDTVIEISSFSVPVGNLGWNTIFWELRNY